MRFSPWLVPAVLLACSGFVGQSHAQQATSEDDMKKAIELLRKLQEEQARKPPQPAPSQTSEPAPAKTPQPPAPAPKPVEPPTPAPAPAPAAPPAVRAPTPAPTGGLTADQEAKAREMLEAIAEEEEIKRKPRVLTPEEQARALEVLRATESPITDAQRQEAIRQAMQEAEALAAQQQAQRDNVNRDLQQVESEILRVKGEPVPDAAAPGTAVTIAPAVTPGAPTTSTTTTITAIPPTVAPVVPAPTAPAPASPQEVSRAQALLDQLTSADAQARKEAMAATAAAATEPRPVAPPTTSQAAPPVATVTPPPRSTPPPATPGNTVPAPGAPLPIPTSKEQQLADLLKRYQNDEITGAEYHRARKEILGIK